MPSVILRKVVMLNPADLKPDMFGEGTDTRAAQVRCRHVYQEGLSSHPPNAHTWCRLVPEVCAHCVYPPAVFLDLAVCGMPLGDGLPGWWCLDHG